MKLSLSFSGWLYCLLLSFVSSAQVPVITNMSPASGQAGTAVSITGSNFNTSAAGNVVYFGAARATITSASANVLTVTVPAGATQAPLTVLNTASGLIGTYHKAPFRVTFPSSGSLGVNDFDPRQDFQVGPGFSGTPNALAAGDIDGDGKVDLVAANNENTNAGRAMYVLRNQSAPGYVSMTAAYTLPLTNSSLSVIVLGDMDGDGRLDIVTNLLGTPSWLVVYRNTSAPGVISFAPPVYLMQNTSSIGVADIDGDGKMDIVTDSVNFYAFRNNSVPGSLAFSARIPVGSTANTTGGSTLQFYDFNGDNKPELITTQVFTNAGKWSVRISTNSSVPGNIAFNTSLLLDSLNGSCSANLAICDQDGDGKADITGGTIVTYPYANSNQVWTWRNTSGAGISFANAQNFTVGTYPYCVATDDLDGDGKADLVAANANGQSISVLHNRATPGTINAASFDPHFAMGTGVLPINMLIADLDGDGKPDIAGIGSYNNVWVFRNHPAPIVSPRPAKGCEGGRTKMFISSPHPGATSYQWELKNSSGGYTAVPNTAPYAGATTDTLQINGLTAALNNTIYRCGVVTNGILKYSLDDTLQVGTLTRPVITRSGNVLSTGSYFSYQWYRNDTLIGGATGMTYTATRNGVYTVIVFNAQGCSDTAKAEAVTGLSVSQAPGADICVFPNPARTRIFISSAAPVQAVLRDLAGRKVLEQGSSGPSVQLDIRSLPAGSYFLYLYNTRQELLKTEKMVITPE